MNLQALRQGKPQIEKKDGQPVYKQYKVCYSAVRDSRPENLSVGDGRQHGALRQISKLTISIPFWEIHKHTYYDCLFQRARLIRAGSFRDRIGCCRLIIGADASTGFVVFFFLFFCPFSLASGVVSVCCDFFVDAADSARVGEASTVRFSVGCGTYTNSQEAIIGKAA